MKPLIILLALLVPPKSHPAVKPLISYTLRVDSTDLSGWEVDIRLRTVSDTIRLAMAAHPEYDDRYFRYVKDFTVEPASAVVSKIDSAVWQIVTPRGDVHVRYRLALPPAAPLPRASWRPFLTPTGGLIGGPHAFMYLLGAERLPVTVTVDLPRSWQVATALTASWNGTFTAANGATLIDSPMLVGRLHQWRFVEAGIFHRIAYWSPLAAIPFDTAAFVSGIQRLVHQAFALFGRAPYREYTFLFEDDAFGGGLEHRNSVTLGAQSAELTRDPNAFIEETAHEFFHTWNLLTIRPVEYRDIDYHTQPPVSSLWFSEGLTMYYADLLLRRAGFALPDSTRLAHLERLLSRYVANPAYERFSAESISRVAYNAAPGALGNYSASTHQQGELLGTMLDFIIRDPSHGGGQGSMDDVMRLLFAHANQSIDGHVIEQAVETVCGCDVSLFFDAYVRGAHRIDYDRYLRLIGLRADVSWAPSISNGQPEPDLRIYGWEPGDGSVLLVVTSPGSIWARAGLHSGDRLISFNGAPVSTWPDLRGRLQRLRLEDSVRIEVQRETGPYTASVIVAGFQRPSVRIEGSPNALGQRWLENR